MISNVCHTSCNVNVLEIYSRRKSRGIFYKNSSSIIECLALASTKRFEFFGSTKIIIDNDNITEHLRSIFDC